MKNDILLIRAAQIPGMGIRHPAAFTAEYQQD